jgi:serine phosphatase RsbU (regulator of sigma subunit)
MIAESTITGQTATRVSPAMNAGFMRAELRSTVLRTDLDSSIFYAAQLQEALLPGKTILNAIFSESFIFYQPKDTVSGDFYWYSRLGDVCVIAVADCTGHGIPGAMMSVLGYTIMEDLVKYKGITEPQKILSRLDQAIRKMLKQGHQGVGMNDGMDMAVCAIDFKNHQIQFAGANRPLYLFKGGNLHVYKGAKKAIGGIHLHGTNFATHVIPFEKGDNLYLFSDGYADQFGGPRDKKFLQSAFTEVLKDIQPLSFEEQEAALRFQHFMWKWDAEQTDDILILGVKL